ncbi:RidA family protein [Hathewaya massiliensis]|uniref:RidA family protein n=1 Tax=Hathewaya massiliensis TaxID=1964382 RepID=UPI001156CC69|nr:RidA family protein [Hathewaya massiliensis]
MKEIISTEKAPKAIGPYSQGIAFKDLIFTSGQLPIDPTTGELECSDIKRATELSIKNVIAVLEEKGSSVDKVIKATIFVKDMNMFADINEVYGRFFSENSPARSCVQVAKLPKDALIEIEAIAYI